MQMVYRGCQGYQQITIRALRSVCAALLRSLCQALLAALLLCLCWLLRAASYAGCVTRAGR
jgi:hypothetical protein